MAADSPDPQDETLEARAVAAQRAYLEALVVWEEAVHRLTCEKCRLRSGSVREQAMACDIAEWEKESRRVAFRDLCDELGYVPHGHGVALPPETYRCDSPMSVH
jgi:hypothetical protein